VQLGEVLMVSKKKRFGDDEIPIFKDGCIYKRGDYWHFRLWLKAENKYACFTGDKDLDPYCLGRPK
jgi:hypothetical protein